MSARRIVWLVCAVAVAGATASTVVVVRQQSTPAVPVLKCESEIDLGDQHFNDQVLARFRVVNPGRAPLALSSFGTSCSCAGVVSEANGEWQRVDEVTVPGGGSAELAVRISVIAAAGRPQTVQVQFRTTDPEHPTHQLVLTIPRVRGNLYCVPAAVVFGSDGPQSRVVRVYENNGGERKVEGVRSTAPDRFTVRQVPTPTDATPHEIGGRLVCEIEVTPVPGYAGSLNGMIELTVSGERGETKTIPVSGAVTAQFSAAPSTVVLPRVAGGKAVWQSELVVSGRDEQPFRLEVKDAPPGLVVRVEPAGEAATFTVHVESAKKEGEPAVEPATLRLIALRSGAPLQTLAVPVHIPR